MNQFQPLLDEPASAVAWNCGRSDATSTGRACQHSELRGGEQRFRARDRSAPTAAAVADLRREFVQRPARALCRLLGAQRAVAAGARPVRCHGSGGLTTSTGDCARECWPASTRPRCVTIR